MKWPNSAKNYERLVEHTHKERYPYAYIHRMIRSMCVWHSVSRLMKKFPHQFFQRFSFRVMITFTSLFVVVFSLKRSRFCNCLQLKQKRKKKNNLIIVFRFCIACAFTYEWPYCLLWWLDIDRFFVGCVAVSKMKRYRLRISRILFN